MKNENSDSSYRDDLASEVKKAPKEERRAILDEAKNNPQYWLAQNEKTKPRQEENEVPTEDGNGLLIKHKTLYHGSSVDDIEEMSEAGDMTIGNGFYCTSEAKPAIGYARLRAEHFKTDPVIYEGSISNLKMLNFQINQNVINFLPGYKQFIQNCQINSDNYMVKLNKDSLIKKIDDVIGGVPIVLKEILGRGYFNQYAESLGYDGIIAYEGGERNIGKHDSYVIFHPEKFKVNQSHKVT